MKNILSVIRCVYLWPIACSVRYFFFSSFLFLKIVEHLNVTSSLVSIIILFSLCMPCFYSYMCLCPTTFRFRRFSRTFKRGSTTKKNRLQLLQLTLTYMFTLLSITLSVSALFVNLLVFNRIFSYASFSTSCRNPKNFPLRFRARSRFDGRFQR